MKNKGQRIRELEDRIARMERLLKRAGIMPASLLERAGITPEMWLDDLVGCDFPEPRLPVPPLGTRTDGSEGSRT